MYSGNCGHSVEEEEQANAIQVGLVHVNRNGVPFKNDDSEEHCYQIEGHIPDVGDTPIGPEIDSTQLLLQLFPRHSFADDVNRVASDD